MLLTVRTIHEQDLDEIMRIQAQCYPPSMQEPREVVLSRISTAGGASLVAVGQHVNAYVFAYRSVLGKASPLDSQFEVAEDGDTLYVHDLAVSPAASGQGWRAGWSRDLSSSRNRSLSRTRASCRCRIHKPSGSATGIGSCRSLALDCARPWLPIPMAPAT